MVNKKKKNESQLYFLLPKLREETDDSDEFAQLVGYTVINSLLGFSTTTGDEEERSFEEMKAIYGGLVATIEKSSKGVSCLPEYMKALDPYFRKFEKPASDSPLLSSIMGRLLPDRDYCDRLRIYGHRLVEIIRKEGEVYGLRESLLKDYHAINSIFTGVKR